MPPVKSDFPPVRACIFDMDGLLLNTEDIYTLCANIVLARHGRPNLPWSVKAKLMGVPGGSTGDSFHEWANLPIPREQYKLEQFEEHKKHFPECMPLPGAEALLEHLNAARNVDDRKVEVALATSSARQNFDLKIRQPESVKLMSHFPEGRRILGDDPRVKKGRGKPAPDIYLLALETINASLEEGEPRISPSECLVFEDSVPGVEAGRRAGMRVVWVPHEGLANELKGKETEVLAGRVGLVKIGDEHQLGQLDDGWAEQRPSLVDFPTSNSKVVLCTGANQGLGYSILKIAGLRHSDYTYILCSRNLAKGKDAADQLKEDGVSAKVDVLELDATKDEHIEQAVAYVDKTYGKLDVLVNNAGILGPFPKKDESLQTVRSRYDLLLSVNLASVAVVTYAFTPLLHKSADPKVISISSGLGSIQLSLTTKMGRFPPYGATKIGLNGLMVHLQVAENDRVEAGGQEAEPACIRHYVCAPGALRTAFSGFKDGLRDPDRGAEVVVRLLEDDKGKYEGGSYWEFEEDEMRRRPW